MKKIRIGVDTGGTFTDFACIDTYGNLKRYKVLSTPWDPTEAIIKGLKALFPELDPESFEIVHGTTVGTNAFLERKGARTVLITTKGFEDTLWIGRQARPRLYDLLCSRPPQIIPRDMVLGIDERLSWKGEVLTQLSRKEIIRARQFCKNQEAESIAICLLHCYAIPIHEQRLYQGLEDLGIQISPSHKILPEFREFERLSTTLINAYIGPVVGDYVKRLSRSLSGARIYIQQSNGGCRPAHGIYKTAVHTFLSGPAGGVQAAFRLGQELGMENIITFDMGGTSTDVSLCPGELTFTRDYKIQGFPIAIPILDIHTVGAGGGSIAWIDAGGILKVGPQSAGADPGPVCYGKGNEITVTDANLFLGRLQPESFLAGRMKIFPQRVGPRMAKLAGEIGLSPIETALGIIKLVNTNMVQALRAVSIERGYDPRDFVLVCFGGAAGLHAAEIAQELEIDRVLLPWMAGVFSAKGMAESEMTFHASRALITKKAQEKTEALGQGLKMLTIELQKEISYAGLSCPIEDIRCDSYLDVRYHGQSYEITIPFKDNWPELFRAYHERLYGYSMSKRDLEVTAIRVRAKITQDSKVDVQGFELETESSRLNDCQRHTVVHFEHGAEKTLVIYRKKMQEEENGIPGPCLILDDFTTILVPPGWRITPLESHLLMKRIGL